MRLTDLQTIKSIDVPTGWEERAISQEPLADKRFRVFSPNASSQVQLRLISRLRKIHSAINEKFSAMLGLDEHTLDVSEWDDLVSIIGDLSDREQFAPSVVQTRNINGRKILWIDGVFSDGFRAAVLFFESNTPGSIQEVWCFAPEAQFSEYEQEFTNAILSIDWN